MARARLHLICGNCGCKDMFSHVIDPTGHDIRGELFPAVLISCGNCATLHDLSDNAPDRKSPLWEAPPAARLRRRLKLALMAFWRQLFQK
ncbi:hypothetical protein HNP46_000499 [Pseudomonas nitritireducens]|uniref:Uncharacterized protein n=1 Tax=Pseudomonas nitroreducens TaxID=46680 RepID=A0A7W7KG68_PSENT|nr:hypothetical protein [Pseudomonas nitritireducens]MBB4861688.1 hypothetical protein [Pseudomonas nitritireducens]